MGTHYAFPVSPKAMKPHRCIACFGRIEAGEVYVMQSGHFESHAFRNKYHIECWDALIGEDCNFEFTPGELEVPDRLKEPATEGGDGR